MALICAGQRTKADVLNETIEEYKEVYMKTKQQMQTLIDAVREYVDGNGNAGAPAPPPQGNAGGARGNGGGGNRRGNNNNDDGDDSDDSQGGGPPAGRGRGGARGGRGGRGGAASAPTHQAASRAAPARAAPPARGAPANRGGRGGGAGPSVNNGRPFPKPDDNDENRNDSSGQGKFRRFIITNLANSYFPTHTGPMCGCHQEAVERTVVKDGPNTGRKFWACMKQRDEGCGFFEWQDDNSNGGAAGGGGYNRMVPKKRTAANIVSILAGSQENFILFPDHLASLTGWRHRDTNCSKVQL